MSHARLPNATLPHADEAVSVSFTPRSPPQQLKSSPQWLILRSGLVRCALKRQKHIMSTVSLNARPRSINFRTSRTTRSIAVAAYWRPWETNEDAPRGPLPCLIWRMYLIRLPASLLSRSIEQHKLCSWTRPSMSGNRWGL